MYLLTMEYKYLLGHSTYYKGYLQKHLIHINASISALRIFGLRRNTFYHVPSCVQCIYFIHGYFENEKLVKIYFLYSLHLRCVITRDASILLAKLLQ